MEQDPGQQHDLSAAMPELAAQLERHICEWEREVRPAREEDRPIPVGYPEFPKTYLNARDAAPTGDITWSSVHPNASFLIHWHNREDEITWEVEVVTAGRYRVTLMYACTAGDEGSDIEVSCGGRAVRARIREPFDPPLKDGDDRVPRSESYEKEFKSFPAGALYLDRGRGTLRLQAVTKAGRYICEVRTLKLELAADDGGRVHRIASVAMTTKRFILRSGG